MQKTLWKGAISFGLVHIPVHLHSAQNNHDLDFTMLDKRDFAPIGYKRVNKETGKEVDWDDIVKGYEYEPDQYVVMSDEDFRRANVEATGTIDILAFVDAQEVPPTYFEQPYYLTPDKGGDKVYALLRETLKQANRIGIAQIVMRARQHLVALLPLDDTIVLNTLRYHDELRPTDSLDVPKNGVKPAGLTEKELKMALALVEGMSDKWAPAQYRNDYKDDVLAMVQKKVKAKQTHTITEPDKEDAAPAKSSNVIDLMALLKQSIDGKGGKGGKSTAGTKAPRKANGKEKAAPAAKRSPAVKAKKAAAAPKRAKAA